MLVKEPGPQGLNPILAFAGWVTLGKFCHLLVPQFPWEFTVPMPPLSQDHQDQRKSEGVVMGGGD